MSPPFVIRIYALWCYEYSASLPIQLTGCSTANVERQQNTGHNAAAMLGEICLLNYPDFATINFNPVNTKPSMPIIAAQTWNTTLETSQINGGSDQGIYFEMWDLETMQSRTWGLKT
jgi:hypothetical protein